MRGQVDENSDDIVEYALNPYQPTLDFFRRWEGKPSELMTQSSQVPQGAVMENVNGTERTNARLARGLEAGSGIRMEDMEHFKSLFDSDITKTIPASWKFSTFFTDFMENRIKVDKIAPFVEVVEAPDIQDEVSDSESSDGKQNVAEDLSEKLKATPKASKAKKGDDQTPKTPKAKLTKQERIERQQEQAVRKYKSFLVKHMEMSLSGERVFGIENSETLKLYEWMFTNKMVKSVKLVDDIGKHLLWCKNEEVLDIHWPWHNIFVMEANQKSAAKTAAKIAIGQEPILGPPEDTYTKIRRLASEKKKGTDKNADGKTDGGNGSDDDDADDDDDDGSSISCPPKAKVAISKLQLDMKGLKAKAKPPPSSDKEDFAKISDREFLNQVESKNNQRLLFGTEGDENAPSLAAHVSREDQADGSKRKRGSEVESPTTVPPALKLHKSGELTANVSEGSETMEDTQKDESKAGDETEREESKADSHGKPASRPSDGDNPVAGKSKVGDETETEETKADSDGKPASRPTGGEKDESKVGDETKNEETKADSDGKPASGPSGGDNPVAGKSKVGDKTETEETKADSDGKPASRPSGAADSGISSDETEEEDVHFMFRGRVINGLGIKEHNKETGTKQTVFAPNATSANVMRSLFKQKKFKSMYTVMKDDDMKAPYLYIFDNKAQADALKGKWMQTGLESADLKITSRTTIDANPGLSTDELFEIK